MISGDERTQMSIARNNSLIVILSSVMMIISIAACVDGGPSRQNGSIEKNSLTILRSNLRALHERAYLRGIETIAPIAGIANAETGLIHCWANATWACRGPASSSCGWGSVIAGAGDGPCDQEQGGLGMFQLDAGTFSQTLAREGSRVLTLEGNIDAGIDFVIRMVRTSKGFRSDRDAISWINGITVGGARYFDWIDIVVQSYNGCVRGRCSVFLDRWYHYDEKTRAVLTEVNRLPPISPPIWIGSSCTQNSDCLFSAEGGVGRCLFGDTNGVCVTPCEGYCPDRAGFATTFCANGAQVGTAAGGVCLSRAHSLNDQCANSEGRWVNRYIGRSGAEAKTERVCVPSRTSVDQSESRSTPPPTGPEEVEEPAETSMEESTEDVRDDEPQGEMSPEAHESLDDEAEEDEVTETREPDERDEDSEESETVNNPRGETSNGGLCGDPSLPLAQASCSALDDERWRCACHEDYGVPVSQVCRNGAWINYRLEPNDCAQCDGAYHPACE